MFDVVSTSVFFAAFGVLSKGADVSSLLVPGNSITEHGSVRLLKGEITPSPTGENSWLLNGNTQNVDDMQFGLQLSVFSSSTCGAVESFNATFNGYRITTTQSDILFTVSAGNKYFSVISDWDGGVIGSNGGEGGGIFTYPECSLNTKLFGLLGENEYNANSIFNGVTWSSSTIDNWQTLRDRLCGGSEDVNNECTLATSNIFGHKNPWTIGINNDILNNELTFIFSSNDNDKYYYQCTFGDSFDENTDIQINITPDFDTEEWGISSVKFDVNCDENFPLTSTLDPVNDEINYINSYGCENIDGGGWQLVRHLKSSPTDGISFADQLEGKQMYGNIDYYGNIDVQSDSSWSIIFNNIEFNQFLFAYGDCSEYLISNKNSVLGEYYINEDRCILSSNRNNYPYYAQWYFRENVRPDPYISTLDFNLCRDGNSNTPQKNCKLYGPHSSDGAYIHGGTNVWIRQKNNEIRECCDELGKKSLLTCNVWGDPHFKTFDGVIHHFQGKGYFDYFKQCYFSNNIFIPIIITGRQNECRDGSRASCLRQVIITIKDENNDIIISYPRGGKNPIFLSDNNGLYGSSAIGSFKYINKYNNGKINVIINDNTFEVSFKMNEFYDGLIKFKYYGQTLSISTTDCLSSYICGLCGTLDNNNLNDFQRCDNNLIIDNTDVIYGNSYKSGWDITQTFGETCCRYDFDLLYIGESDCNITNVTISPPPSEICTDSSYEICTRAVNTYCQFCDSSVTSKLIESCEIDVCMDSECSDIEINNFDFDTALNLGCLDTVIEHCDISCPEPTLIPTNNPSNIPTNSPTNIPTISLNNKCLGCSSGGTISNGDCYELGNRYNISSSSSSSSSSSNSGSISNIFACYGEFTGGLNDESFDNICDNGYHVCKSEYEASNLGLTLSECISVGSNEIFFLKESFACDGNSVSLTKSDNINDFRGCSGAINNLDNNFIYEKECIYVSEYIQYSCGVISHICGYWEERNVNNEILDQGTDTFNEYNNVALKNSNYGGALCCIDSYNDQIE